MLTAPSLLGVEPIDRFPNYCLGARRGKDLVAKGCYGPWRILLNVNPESIKQRVCLPLPSPSA